MIETVEVTTFLTQHALKQNGIPLDMNISKHRKDMKDSGVASKFPDKLQIWFEPEAVPANPSYNIKTVAEIFKSPQKSVFKQDFLFLQLKVCWLYFSFFGGRGFV